MLSDALNGWRAVLALVMGTALLVFVIQRFTIDPKVPRVKLNEYSTRDVSLQLGLGILIGGTLAYSGFTSLVSETRSLGSSLALVAVGMIGLEYWLLREARRDVADAWHAQGVAAHRAYLLEQWLRNATLDPGDLPPAADVARSLAVDEDEDWDEIDADYSDGA